MNLDCVADPPVELLDCPNVRMNGDYQTDSLVFGKDNMDSAGQNKAEISIYCSVTLLEKTTKGNAVLTCFIVKIIVKT